MNSEPWHGALSHARLRAIRLAPYLATALLRLRPVAVPGLGTMGVDPSWRLYVDPAALQRWGEQASAGVLLHEVGHLLRNHAGRRPTDVPHALWNVAGDLEINDDLAAAGIELPEGILIPELLGLQPGGSAEQYLADIGNDAAQIPVQVRLLARDCGSGAHGQPCNHDLPPDASCPTDMEVQAIRRDTARRIRLAGDQVSTGWRMWAEATLEPTISWHRLLATVLGRATAAASRGAATDWTWRRRSRRLSDGIAALPTLTPAGLDVALLIDTSGSISPAELGIAATEIRNAARALGRVRVWTCDTTARDLGYVQRLTARDLHGGGGTNLVAGISAVLAAAPPPQLLVVMTDGVTPWPAKKPDAAVVILVTGTTSVTVPDWVHSVIVVPSVALDGPVAPGTDLVAGLHLTGGKHAAPVGAVARRIGAHW